MKTSPRLFLRYGVPLLAGMGVIFYLSSRPGDTFEAYHFPYADKIAHLVLYTGLGFLFGRLLTAGRSQKLEAKRVILWTTCFTALYGVTDEWHQSFVAGRHVEVADMIMNTLGGLIGGLLMKPYRRFTNRLRNL